MRAAALSSGNVTPGQLSGVRYFIVADLTIGGAQILAATAELAIPWAAAGRTLCASHYLSRPIDVTLDAGWGKPENAPGEAVIEIPIAGRLVELRRAGSLGSGVRCEVFLWAEGTDYTAREVLVTGAARLVQWGADGEAVVFNVRQDAGDSAARPIVLGAIDTSFGLISIIDPVEDNIGKAYPLVFGPGEDGSAIRGYRVRRSEGIPYAQNTSTAEVVRVAIAGHRVEATEVTIVDADGGSDTRTIEYRQDATGRDVASVNLVGSALNVAEGTAYSVKWIGDGGGLLDDGRVVRGAGHLISYLLRSAQIPVDAARLAAARTVLDAFSVAGMIDEPVGALAYIGDALASVLPFTLTAGPEGFWPWPWPLAPRRSEAVADIDPARGDAVRSSELIIDDADVVNEITLGYGYDFATNSDTRTLTAGGVGTGSPLGACINSQARYGVRAVSLQTPVIEASGSASRAVAARLLALAEPRPRVSYDLATSYGWLRPRQIVTLTDADIDVGGIGVVDKLTLSEVGITAEILILTPGVE